MYFIINSN